MSTVYGDSTLAIANDWQILSMDSLPPSEISVIFIGKQAHTLHEQLTGLSSNYTNFFFRAATIDQAYKYLSTLPGDKVIVCDIDIDESIIQPISQYKVNTTVIFYSEVYFQPHITKVLSLKADDYLYLDLGLQNILERLITLGMLKSKISDISGRKTDSSLPKPFKKSLAKSLLDTTVAFSLLLLLSPLFLFIIILIKLKSKGSAFYVSKRVGTNYTIFNFYKFRTMKIGANDMRNSLKHLNTYRDNEQKGNYEEPCFFKIKNDPRVTRIGRFLRKTSLDEFPQLYNVLKGDMSLVGNRPLPVDEAASLTKDRWAVRFLAPSGITGLWQVSQQKESMTVSQRIKLDLKYRKQMSLTKDIKILLKTFPSMLQQE